MSIPLDRLYHYIESVARDVYGDTVIYHFYPHGSKKIENLELFKYYEYRTILTSPQIICYDQEPLNYDFYKTCISVPIPEAGLKLLGPDVKVIQNNLRKDPYNIHNKCLLLHSEKNSHEVNKYSNSNFIPVYYWNHAILALDWYRYAQYITPQRGTKNKKFLIYNRAWTGSREYRLKFADLLIDNHLLDQCQTSCAFINDQTHEHYSKHLFLNPTWKPTHILENHIDNNSTHSDYSADFDLNDYSNTDIEVVLETLFDDSRLHLTEKIFRPIALGQPFILASTPNSLEYLRSYGFKTFKHLIDESYDTIINPQQRLTAIVTLMNNINNLPNKEYQDLIRNLQIIADYNKNHLYSDEFFNLVTNELKTNLRSAFEEFKKTKDYSRYYNFKNTIENNKQYVQWRESNLPRDLLDHLAILHQEMLSIIQNNNQ